VADERLFGFLGVDEDRIDNHPLRPNARPDPCRTIQQLYVKIPDLFDRGEQNVATDQSLLKDVVTAIFTYRLEQQWLPSGAQNKRRRNQDFISKCSPFKKRFEFRGLRGVQHASGAGGLASWNTDLFKLEQISVAKAGRA